MPVKNHERTFALYISHDLSNAILWRYADQHVDMIRTQLRLDYFYSLLIAQLSYDLSYVAFDLSVNCLSSILRCKYYVATLMLALEVLFLKLKPLILTGIAGGLITLKLQLKRPLCCNTERPVNHCRQRRMIRRKPYLPYFSISLLNPGIEFLIISLDTQ